MERLSSHRYGPQLVSGKGAWDLWKRLKADGSGSPVIVGGGEKLEQLLDAFSSGGCLDETLSATTQSVSIADNLVHPQSLRDHREKEKKNAEEFYENNPEALEQYLYIVEANGIRKVKIKDLPTDNEAPVGEWPVFVPPIPALTVIEDWSTGGYFDTVLVLKAPTKDWTIIPAYLCWGGWNANPPAEVHIAALRSWRDRYGAELVGLGMDTMNIRVAKRPQTRDEALELARELYTYCPDIVDQGVGTLSNLAAGLMISHWWFFWWD